MIGLKLPKLFYGRKQRQKVTGVRADFCEFCAIVSRHWVVSFESAPTVFFVPLKYEEVKKESRCEVCRSQFPLAVDGRSTSLPQGLSKSIDDLIEETNPGVDQRALVEIDQMNKRSSGPKAGRLGLIEQNRLTNFFRRHEASYLEKIREFPPFVAVASIQAAILGLAFSVFVPWWLAISFAASLFLLGVLSFFLLIRKRILAMFERSALRLLAVTGQNVDQLEEHVRQYSQRFPRSASIVYRQLMQLSPADLKRFENGREFLTLQDKLDKIPQL